MWLNKNEKLTWRCGRWASWSHLSRGPATCFRFWRELQQRVSICEMIWRRDLLPEMALNVVLNHMLVPHWSSLQGYVRIESRPCLSKNYLRLATWSTGVVFDQFVAMSSAGQSVPHASRTWRGFVLKDPNGFAMIIKLDFCCQHFEFMLTRVLDLSNLNLEDFLYFAAKFVTGISIGI